MDIRSYYNKLSLDYKAFLERYFNLNSRTVRRLVIWEMYYGVKFPFYKDSPKRNQYQLADLFLTQQPNISASLRTLRRVGEENNILEKVS